ncbi:unnamed protein product [Prorocentrum cordatum]|uniref:Acyltransferase 3 domain-containing protein n=1 Tax=Prorocentrum cordatum TaxID=2364126 RepID=A0ABN9US24_9DINO|nr:unnamed protein product [Polarella glacialis]
MSHSPSESKLPEPPRQQLRLPHLDGARVLVALWIVCHHMAPRDDPESVLDPLTERVDVGVEFFTLLSGFLTHLTYSGEDLLSTAGSLVHFWARRAGRAVAVAQLAMLAAAALDGLAGIPVLSWRLLGCLCFARPWFSPAPDCPNMPVWYLAALLPSWMLYPFVLQPVLCAAAHWRPWRLGLLLLAAWAAAIGPQLAVIAWNGGWMSWNQVVRTWFWPPAQLADFALGATAAAVRLRWPPPPASGPAGDAAVAALLLACLLAPPAAEPPPDFQQWRSVLARLEL